jgi:excisionase family DNA binding protein
VATLYQLIDTLTELANEVPVATAGVTGDHLPLLLNAVETGRLLSISRAKVLDLAARGQIPCVRVGGSVRIPRDLLVAWIASNCTTAGSTSSMRAPVWAHGSRTAAL